MPGEKCSANSAVGDAAVPLFSTSVAECALTEGGSSQSQPEEKRQFLNGIRPLTPERQQQSKRKERASLICTVEGCGRKFQKKAYFERHKLCHSDERNFKCQTCGSAFKRGEHLERHKILRHNVNQERTKGRNAAAAPTESATPPEGAENSASSKTHMCEHCGKAFILNYHLRRHLKTHMLLYKCQICAEKFARKRQLRRHMLLHLVETPTGSETPRPERHTGGKAAENNRLEPEELVPVETNTAKLSTMEPSKDVQECLTGSLLCPHHNCGKVFTSLEQLYRHLKRAAQRQRDYVCADCSASFPVFSALVAHKRSAHSTKLHVCEHCGKAYTRPERLKAHSKAKHPSDYDPEGGDEIDGVCNFQCSDCSLSFSSKSNLRVHVRVKHLNEKRFACTMCGMKFAYKSVMRRHIASIHGLDASGKPSTSESAQQGSVVSSSPPVSVVNGSGPNVSEGIVQKSDATSPDPAKPLNGQSSDSRTSSLLGADLPRNSTAEGRFLVDAVSVDLMTPL